MERECYICSASDIELKHNGVRDHKDIDVLLCKNCGLVFLSSNAMIDDNFYEKSLMHKKNTSIDEWIATTQMDDGRRYDYLKDAIVGKKVLDFGSGNGGFLSRVMGSTKIAVGVELEERVKDHYDSCKIPLYRQMDEINEKFDYITLFHVLEHLSEPARILSNLSSLLEAGGQIIVEVPNSEDALIALYDSKAFQDFTYWSCHLFLFNETTLKLLVEKAGLKLNYIKQIQRYPLSNHLFWLAHGKPGGQEYYKILEDQALTLAYNNKLASLGMCDTIYASISKNNEV